ncbi:MAG: HNH endonuclease [Acidobacteria bacterium]|nr:HNH endonuclease [Acidobacteriota bacterium]
MIGAEDLLAKAERLLALLDQGSFTATYKYAVLLGLMDLCLEKTARDGSAPDALTTRELAEKVVDLYWPQTSAFRGETLRQNTGRPARILSDLLAFRDALPDPSLPLYRARRADPAGWERTVRQVEWTLILMPLPRLQTVGRETEPVIYTLGWDLGIEKRKADVLRYQQTGAGPFDNRILLLPGAGEALARLNGLLRPLVHRAWASMVARLNALDASRLEDFLFGVDRRALSAVRPDLVELQGGRCFYCGSRLVSRAEVDHFVPFARHPDNGLANLVAADPRCNAHKRDFIAAGAHLGRWLERNRTREADLRGLAERKNLEDHPAETLGVARGLYLRLPPRTLLWDRENRFQPADPAALRTLLTA